MKTVVIMLMVALVTPGRAHAYLHFTVTVAGQSTTLKWQRTPVRWFATDRGAPGVSSSEFQAAVARAFATWQAVPTASVAFQFAGLTGAEPFDDDGVSTIGFQAHPDMERVLGATGFLIDTVTGEILESDVFFNTAFPLVDRRAERFRARRPRVDRRPRGRALPRARTLRDRRNGTAAGGRATRSGRRRRDVSHRNGPRQYSFSRTAAGRCGGRV